MCLITHILYIEIVRVSMVTVMGIKQSMQEDLDGLPFPHNKMDSIPEYSSYKKIKKIKVKMKLD